MADVNNKDGKRTLTKSEKFKNYCLGIAGLTALILGTFNVMKGEPTAEKAWTTSEKAINKNRKVINNLGDGMRKLHLMFVHMQGQAEGYNNAKLLTKIEKLEKMNAQLKRAPNKRPRNKGFTKLASDNKPVVLKKKCAPGWVEAAGKCRKSTRTIAKAMSDAKFNMQKAQRTLRLEKARRRAAEQAKAAAQKMAAPKHPEKLEPMPKNLDRASTRKK